MISDFIANNMGFLVGTLVALGPVFIGVSALAAYVSYTRHQSYNDKSSKIELEKIRSSIEDKIYSLERTLASSETRWMDVNHLVRSQLDSQHISTRMGGDKPISDGKRIQRFLDPFGISSSELEADPTLVLSLGPFNKSYSETHQIVQRACNQLNLRCVRGDEEFIKGDIFSHILKLMVRSRFVIANIDGRNPNVFYELGVAHALSKLVIVITSDIDAVPFDLQSRRLVIFKSPEDLLGSLNTEIARSVLHETKR